MGPFTVEQRQNFLADKHVGVLSVAADQGRPPASVPIWYDYTRRAHPDQHWGGFAQGSLD